MATHNRLGQFKERCLSLPGRGSLPSSIPLVLPDDTTYDSATNTVQPNKMPRSQLCLVGDAVQLLRSIEKPIAVLSICGPYRTGKSYILSRLLGAPGAFSLGHSMHACTFGIWMGTTVLECEKFVLVFLDTEGIDAVSGSQSDDASILVMTILLSSYMIYNSQRVPQKTDLEKMRYFLIFCLRWFSVRFVTSQDRTLCDNIHDYIRYLI